jgi:signal peptidase I
MRFLVPSRAEAGPGLWGWLGRLGHEQTLLLEVGLFLLFSLLVRQFADRLPGGAHLVPAAPAATEAPWRRAASWVATLVLAVVAALLVRASVGQPYQVSGTSMLPAFEPRDTVLLDKTAYGFRWPGQGASRLPRRGDLVFFTGAAVGESSEELLVKRVIGLPGDHISTRGGRVTINGWRVPFCDAGRYIHLQDGNTVVGRLIVEFLEDRAHVLLILPESVPFAGQTVKEGEVFVVADNRNGGRDSRGWQNGLPAGVPLAAIQGRAWRIIGHDRDGRLDLRNFLRRPDGAPRFLGMDARAVEQKIASCLANRPAQTWPPPPVGPTSSVPPS